MAAITDQQREAWNNFSGGWLKWDALNMANLKPIGDSLLGLLELLPTDTVLDVSTGTGEPGLTAATKVAHVMATDVAEHMVAIAKRNAANRNLKNFKATIADAEHLPFDDESFDAVVCRLGVMFFNDPQAGVVEMARVLKPGRKVALAAWTGPEKNPWAAVCSDSVTKILGITPPPLDAPGLYRQREPGKLTELLTAAGFTQVTQTEINGDWMIESPEKYWEYVTDVVMPVAIPLRSAAPEQREQAKKAVIKACAAYQKDGKTVFPWSCWIAAGTKT